MFRFTIRDVLWLGITAVLGVGQLVTLQVQACAAPQLAMDELERILGTPPSGDSVLGLLESGDPSIRRLAAQAMAELGPSSGIEPQSLLRFLRDDDKAIRGHIARAIKEMGPVTGAIEELERCLNDPEWSVRGAAAIALGQASEAEKPCPTLAKLLKNDESEIVAEAAAMSLSRIGLKQHDCIDSIVDVVVDSSRPHRVRLAAAHALWACTIPNSARSRIRESIPESLDGAFGHSADSNHASEKQMLQLATIVAIAHSEFDSKYIRILVSEGKANYKNEAIVEEVANGLGCLKKRGRDGVPFLLDVVDRWQKDKSTLYHASQSAIRALGESAPDDPSVIQALGDSITSVSDAHAEAAIHGLRSSKELSARDIILQALNMPSPNIRLLAARAYFESTGQASVILPIVIDVLRINDRDAFPLTVTGFARQRELARLRTRAVILLGEMGPDAREAERDIVCFQDDPFRDLAMASKRSLAQIRDQSKK